MARSPAIWCAPLLLMVAGCSQPHPASPSTVSPEPEVKAIDPADVIVTSEAWTFEDKDGRLIRTPSYRLFTTASKYGLADRMPLFMEHCLLHYSTSLVELPRPERELETYLLANRPQWTRVTQRVMGDQAETYLKIQRGGFSAGGRAILYDIGPRDTFFIAAHEGWHQYTQTTFRSPLTVCFEEGMSCFMEGFRWADSSRTRPDFRPWSNFERFEQLRKAHSAGKLLSLERLQQSTPQDLIAESQEAALTYYAQVWALIHFLNEGEGGRHQPALKQLLKDAASGELSRKIRRDLGPRAASAYHNRRTGVDFFALYFGASADQLDGEYRAFVDRIVRVGARERIATGKSPIPE